jgi:hypothetical protein
MKAPSLLLAAVLCGAFACGVAARASSATAAETHTLTIDVRGRHMCLSAVPQPPLGRITRASDRFELVAPGKGQSAAGRVLAYQTGVVAVNRGCAINVSFRIDSKLGRFSFYDRSNGDIWFGFNSSRLPERGWELTIVE